MPQTSWGNIHYDLNEFICPQFICLDNETILCRNEITDDQGNPSSGSTM